MGKLTLRGGTIQIFVRLLLVVAIGVGVPAAAAQEADAQRAAEATGRSLDTVLAPILEDRLFRTANAGVQVVDLQTGEELFAHQADVPFIPASTTKILTAAVALEHLGPAYTFSTHIYRDGDITPEGVLEGNLYVKGFGDPTLVVERVWRMIHNLRMEGIYEIEGDVIFDDDFFDEDYLIAGWRKKVDLANGPAYFPPVGALSVNYNTACIVVGPGTEPGQPARVELDTPAAVIAIENETTTGPEGSRSWLKVEREVDTKARTVTFTVEGQVPLDGGVNRYYRTVDEPVAHFMAVFADLIKNADIEVGGRYTDGSTPDDAELVTRSDSDSLANLLTMLNKRSNNLVAEHVLKAVGAEVHGVPGTTDKGVQVVKDYLARLGFPRDDAVLVNGSGLAPHMMLKPRHLTAVLYDQHHNRRYGAEFTSSLAIGGLDGTLWRRFRAEDEVGRVRGKTGSINGVHCLAGIVEGGDGRLYGFAFMVNDLRGWSWPAKKVHDQFVGELLHLADATLAEGPEESAGEHDAAP